MRLLRPGALVAGIAGGRCVLVRAVADAGAGAPWVAALEAGCRCRRCARRDAASETCWLRRPRTARSCRPPWATWRNRRRPRSGAALAGHGIADSRAAAGDLVVCDGVLLVVRAPAARPAEGDDGAAAFAAMVAAACAPEAVAVVRRRQRAVPAAIVAVAVVAVVVTLVPWPGRPATKRRGPRRRRCRPCRAWLSRLSCPSPSRSHPSCGCASRSRGRRRRRRSRRSAAWLRRRRPRSPSAPARCRRRGRRPPGRPPTTSRSRVATLIRCPPCEPGLLHSPHAPRQRRGTPVARPRRGGARAFLRRTRSSRSAPPW